MTKQTHFYVKVIKQGSELFTGYGVTDDIDTRDATHLENLTQAGYTVVSTEKFPFPTRAEADDLEKNVKRNTRLIDLGVDGFRTEAAPFEQYAHIVSMAVRAQSGKQPTANRAREEEEPYYRATLSTSEKATLDKWIGYWQAKLETAWGGKIAGQKYRDDARECLVASLHNLGADDEEVTIFFPEGWDHEEDTKPATEMTDYYSPVELDRLRRSVVDVQDKENRRLERKRSAAKIAKKNKWYLELSKEDQTLLQRDTLSFYDYSHNEDKGGWREGHHDNILGETKELRLYKSRLAFLKECIAILETLDPRIIQVACNSRSHRLTNSETLAQFKVNIAKAQKYFEDRCADELSKEGAKKEADFNQWYQTALNDAQKKFFNEKIKYQKDYPTLSLDQVQKLFEETYVALPPTTIDLVGRFLRA